MKLNETNPERKGGDLTSATETLGRIPVGTERFGGPEVEDGFSDVDELSRWHRVPIKRNNPRCVNSQLMIEGVCRVILERLKIPGASIISVSCG